MCQDKYNSFPWSPGTADNPNPCTGCECDVQGVLSLPGLPSGDCIKDSTYLDTKGQPIPAGQCFCRPGYTGLSRVFDILSGLRVFDILSGLLTAQREYQKLC
eukprot:sb/3478340/